MLNKSTLAHYHGAIAIQRDGHVGIVMDSSANALIIDGESVHADDCRAVPTAADESSIMQLAAELGHDIDAQKGIAECIRLLREKQAAKLVGLDVKTFEAPSPSVSFNDALFAPGTVQSPSDFDPFAEESDGRTMSLLGKRVRIDTGEVGVIEAVNGTEMQFLEDGRATPLKIYREEIMSVISNDVPSPEVVPANLQATIDSLRAEVKLLEKANDALLQKTDSSVALEEAKRSLEHETAARKKAEAAIEDAMALKLKAENAAILADFELRKLRNSVPLAPKLPGLEAIPYKQNPKTFIKICRTTSEIEFAEMLDADWELFHTEFNEAGDVRTVWRKLNEYNRPDGSPLRESVALPTYPSPSMEENEITQRVPIEMVDAALYGVPVPSVNEVIEIPATDLFPRFDKLETLVKDLPIAQALLKHGPDVVNAAFDEMAQRAYADAIAPMLAPRPVHQFSLPEQV